VFENVTYCYPNQEKNVLTNFDYCFHENKTTLIKGASGVGKTTLINLALGFLKPQNGAVYLVQNGRKYSATGSFTGARYVSQQVHLLDESIGHNIAMRSITDDDEDALIQAAESVGIYDRVLKSAEGFHELVGENGVRISAGERQRIGIARALFDAPSLIVLDEPTANLDSISETQVWKALENIKGRATILIISHRDTPESVYDSKLEFEKL